MSSDQPTSVRSTTVVVNGMSCDHCVRAVTEEVSGLTGVTAVAVDLGTGVVSIDSTAPLDPDAISRAVEAAGYEVVP